MKLIKTIGNIKIEFEIKNPTSEIKQEKTLSDIIKSLNDFKFINKSLPFNDLIKKQQKSPRHGLVEFDTKPYDEMKFICKAVFNFLKETNQLKHFTINEITFKLDNDDELILYGTEQFSVYDEHGYRIRDESKITFSPIIRSEWSDPTLIEKILLRS